jgi:hypothetical protein
VCNRRWILTDADSNKRKVDVMRGRKLLMSVLAVGLLGVAASWAAPEKTVRHVVIFKYKQGAEPEKVKQVTEAFRALSNKIPGIVSFETGVNTSPEGKNQGFTHVYLLTFTNEKARNNYLPHPEHKKFGQLLGQLGVVEDVFVVDYFPEK